MRVLPADVYDTLEFAALAFGGIGRGPYEVYRGVDDVCPVCIHGLAFAAENTSRLEGASEGLKGISRVLDDAGLYGIDSDHAVRGIQDRKGLEGTANVTFEEWCKELDVVRGES